MSPSAPHTASSITGFAITLDQFNNMSMEKKLESLYLATMRNLALQTETAGYLAAIVGKLQETLAQDAGPQPAPDAVMLAILGRLESIETMLQRG